MIFFRSGLVIAEIPIINANLTPTPSFFSYFMIESKDKKRRFGHAE
jgi:hypothetical protein